MRGIRFLGASAKRLNRKEREGCKEEHEASKSSPAKSPRKSHKSRWYLRDFGGGFFYHAFKTLHVETQNIWPGRQWRFTQAARKCEKTAEGTKTRKGGAEVNIRIIKKPLEKQFNSNADAVVGGLWVVDSIQRGESLFDW